MVRVPLAHSSNIKKVVFFLCYKRLYVSLVSVSTYVPIPLLQVRSQVPPADVCFRLTFCRNYIIL
jgi:hypothetical protein